MSELPPHEPSADQATAAEHALGVLEGVERAAAERRRLADSEFAREVQAWEVRLAGLAETVAPVAPPADLWARIARWLDGEAARGEVAQVVVLKLKRSIALWRASTGLAAAVAASLLVTLALPHRPVAPAAPPPMLAARLAGSAKGPAVFVALYDPTRRAIVLTPASVTASKGHSPELWLIPTGGKPIPLGVADFVGPAQLISTTQGAGLGAGVLAVSLEPKGGSPTGQPTGPVIATGHLSQL
jgi:anti-sigma-K factor RskA